MKQQAIVHISEEISSLEGIYDLFRHSGGINFPSNLDALEDILSDIPGLYIFIDDIANFRTIFDSKMTEKYFLNAQNDEGVPMSDILIEIFSPYLVRSIA